jgi:hypothetical protein
MTNSLRLLIVWSLCYLAGSVAGAILSISQHLPARFGGILSGNDVAMDFLTFNGTALSPALFMLLAQVAFMVLALGSGRGRRVGIIGLTVLGALYVLGQLGEPIAVEAFRSFNLAQAIILIANLLFAALMAVFGAIAWREMATTQPASR